MLASVQNVCTWRNLLLQEFSGNSLVLRVWIGKEYCALDNAISPLHSFHCNAMILQLEVCFALKIYDPKVCHYKDDPRESSETLRLEGSISKNSFFIYERENNLQSILPRVNEYYIPY